MPLTDGPRPSLRLTEARARGAMLTVTAYDVTLDLTVDERRFASDTTISFHSTGGRTFLDLLPDCVGRITLNGDRLDPGLLAGGRLPLDTQPGGNLLEVQALMRYRSDGEGLHRSVDPADGRHYLYGMSFLDAAPSIFACFDQPDLKAPFRLHVRAPRDWVVVGNAPGEQVEPGVWELPATPPLPTYLVTLVAGPYHLVRDSHDGVPLGLSARASSAAELDRDAEELFALTRRGLDELHRLFGVRYPFAGYHQAFVPDLGPGAMENAGCVTIRDPYLFAGPVARGERIRRATTMAHELAHQWFGNLVTPRWWDDLWLNESFAEYLGIRVTADVTEYADAWVHHSHARRRWGLAADLRPTTHPVAAATAPDAATALQSFDGISYAKGAAVLKQLAAHLGDEVFFAGVTDHLRRHRFGSAEARDLVGSWERAGGVDLGAWVDSWLRTSGPDLLAHDRAAGLVRRTPPAVAEAPPGPAAGRSHAVHVALGRPGTGWRVERLRVDGPTAALPAEPGQAVLVDVWEETWAVTRPDPVTLAALADLLPATEDPMLRAAAWNDVRGAFHDAVLAPEDVLRLVESAIPGEESDDALTQVLAWTATEVAPLAVDPRSALARVQAAARQRLASAPAGSSTQLAAFRAVVDTASPDAGLAEWCDGYRLPEGLTLDLELRWRILVRMAVLGLTDRVELDDRLRAEPTARSKVEQARALASLPDAEAKAWAWRRFRGLDVVPVYELEATGLGMWRWGQEELTGPYVDRFLSELPSSRGAFAGSLLADVADWFFPVTSLDEDTLRGVEALGCDGELDEGQRRRIRDRADDLRRRLAVRDRFGSAAGRAAADGLRRAVTG